MEQFKGKFRPKFLVVISSLIPCIVIALPQPPQIISGDATCSHPDDRTMVIEAGNRTILQYTSFNVGGAEKVQFIQPSSSSVVLNRVEGSEVSSILGRIESNGRVFLVNPNGVYFGKNSHVDVGSLIVSTMGIQDQDFLQDRFQFSQNNLSFSSIINQGTINAVDDVALLASQVVNEGSIVAQAGKVALAAGEKVVLNFSDTGLVQFSVNGELEKALISQSGSIEATEGEVVLRMGAVRKIVESVMNVDGIVEANELVEKDGVFCLGKSSGMGSKGIEISGKKGSKLSVEEEGVITLGKNSTLSSKGVEISGQKGSKLVLDGQVNTSKEADVGGKVHLFGETIHLGTAEIQTSGALGGGEVLIGGDLRGSGPYFKAQEVLVHPETRIFASALTDGSGGKVIIWAKEKMYFGGKIESRGGAMGGNGGFVETSGKKSLGIDTGRVDTSAPLGKTGTWLLDPQLMEMRTWTQGLDTSPETGVDPRAFSDSATNMILSVKGQEGSITIADGLVINHPNAGITMNGKVYLKGPVETQGGEITFQGPVVMSGKEVSINSAGGGSKGAGIVFQDSVDSGAVRTSLSLSAGEEGSIRFDGGLGEDSPLTALSVTSAYQVSFARDVIIAGGDVLLNAPVALMGDVKVDTTAKATVERGGNIAILQGVDGNNRLQLNAGSSGNIIMGKGAGIERALFALHMKGKTISLTGDIKADGGTLTYYGNVVLGGNLTMEDTGPTGITFLGTLDGNHTLTLSAPLGKVSFFGEVGSTTALQNLVVSSSEIRIKSDVTVTTLFDMNGAVTLLGSSSITSTNIHFGKTLDGLYNLSLNAGSSGSIALDYRAGGLARLGNLTIVNTGTLTTQEIYAKTITQTAGSTSSVFNGVLDTLYSGGISLTANAFTFAAGLTTLNGGSFTLNNAGAASFTGSGAITLTGSFSQIGAGSVSLATSIATAGKNILFTSAVTLPSSVSLDTGDYGFGSVSFLSTVNGPGSLSLTLGMGDLLFNQDIGQITALGAVSIVSARNVQVAKVNASSLIQESGFGIATYSSSITTTGVTGISLTSNELDLVGTESSQVLTTTGSGNIVMNSLYTDIGTVASPIDINVQSGTGTFFEGSSGTVYVSGGSEVGKFCSVRSNPGCLVLQGGVDVTPNICCSNTPSPPPPPPPSPTPCPPCPSNCHVSRHGPLHSIFEYIPGIYTNYWIEKDTQGSPWYFDLGLITDEMVSPWKGDLYWGDVTPPPYRVSQCKSE